ncbi:hypothetical protein, partial [Micrococcus aloeverae]|uniref:hypothetical protein n=2 Tax=Micrococcus aloeverae TaxID=1391911 RepID=UPI001ADDA7D2
MQTAADDGARRRGQGVLLERSPDVGDADAEAVVAVGSGADSVGSGAGSVAGALVDGPDALVDGPDGLGDVGVGDVGVGVAEVGVGSVAYTHLKKKRIRIQEVDAEGISTF